MISLTSLILILFVHSIGSVGTAKRPRLLTSGNRGNGCRQTLIFVTFSVYNRQKIKTKQQKLKTVFHSGFWPRMGRGGPEEG